MSDVNRRRLPRLLNPLLSVAARVTRRSYFWYADTGPLRLWWGDPRKVLR